jgi:hypothetical protein
MVVLYFPVAILMCKQVWQSESTLLKLGHICSEDHNFPRTGSIKENDVLMEVPGVQCRASVWANDLPSFNSLEGDQLKGRSVVG